MTRKERRLARRDRRRIRKEGQKAKWAALQAAIATTPDMDDLESSKYEDRFSDVWPAVKAALEFAITLRITREKVDKALSRTILIGDRMAGGQGITDEQSLEFLEKLEKVWNWIRKTLVVVKIFTGDDVDRAIDKIIEIGDWILGDDDDDDDDS